jgi:hypothetical protein
MLDMSLCGEQLVKSLNEAMQWCAAFADVSCPATTLRSAALEPRRLEHSYIATVESVCSARAASIWRAKEISGSAAECVYLGKLMLYYPEVDLACGGPEAGSFGYFDRNSCPPWDSLVAIVEDTMLRQPDVLVTALLAWVRQAMVAIADDGIESSPEGSIEWLSSEAATRFGLVHLLHAA